MGEQQREEWSNNLWITSPWVNIKVFIISQINRGPEEQIIQTKGYARTILFLVIKTVTLNDQIVNSVCVFSQGDSRAFADETTASYTQAD